jgi:hypothetical protein
VEEHAPPVVDIVADIRAEAFALEASAGFPGSLAARARAASRWMGTGAPGTPSSKGAGDVRFAAHLVARQASRHLEPPAIPGTGVRRLVKVAVRALVGWYGRYLCRHLGAVGQAFSRLGLAVADRIDRLEADEAKDRNALRAELAELRARIAALEQAAAPDRFKTGR